MSTMHANYRGCFCIRHVCDFIEQQLYAACEGASRVCTDTDAFRILLQMVLYAKGAAVLQPMQKLFAAVLTRSSSQMEEFLLLGQAIVSVERLCCENSEIRGNPLRVLKGCSMKKLPFIDPEQPVPINVDLYCEPRVSNA